MSLLKLIERDHPEYIHRPTNNSAAGPTGRPPAQQPASTVSEPSSHNEAAIEYPRVASASLVIYPEIDAVGH